jgi:signal transduction histidine kinase
MDHPGRWAGGFRAWDDDGVYLATGRGAVPGRVLRVPATRLRELFDDWFPFGVHLISGLYRTARSIESTARQRDSLVTLGTLAAGFAHEINNPAAATTRAVASLEEACTTLLASLGRLAEGEISAAQFVALDGLRREIVPRPGVLNTLDQSDREDELSDWLVAHGVGNEWTIASTLATAGVDVAWCDRAADLLAGEALEHGLQWVASTFAATSLLAEVKESTRRVSELVAAVRSYSQMDRASRQPTDVAEGLESTLVMLGGKFRSGVSVVREYDADLPRIEAYPGELNQVWTNLVENAVDAMEGSGILRVAARPDGDGGVLVDIADTGPGMPPEVVARAFEAFFTTKDVGRGTGLGLDIARRIVEERHGGRIVIDTSARGTTMRIALLARAPD